jgi:hypothetical protein
VESSIEGAHAFAVVVGHLIERRMHIDRDTTLLIVGAGRRQRGGGGFQRDAKRKHLFGFPGVERAHEEAPIGLRANEPFLLQAGQRFAERDFRDAELGCQRILSDRLIRRHKSLKNAIPNEIDELVGKITDDNAGHEIALLQAGPMGPYSPHFVAQAA